MPNNNNVPVDEEKLTEAVAEEEVAEAVVEEKVAEEPKQATPLDSDDMFAVGPKLRALLEQDIKENQKRQKTRAAEMLTIFAAHNFYSNGLTPEELRTTLEDLGPTYVKIGQIMSSRPDMLPEAYCKELEKLRQTVKPLDPAIVRAIIEDETGKEIDDIFSEFRDKPLGSASIGQAHYAMLKDGTKVVIKVQRPLIAEMMVKDFSLLKKLAGLVNIVTDTDKDDKVVDLVSVIKELEEVSMQELDFRVEAENTRFFKENCIEDEAVLSCPSVIDELSTRRMFTMTFVDGCSVSHTDELKAEGRDLEAIGSALVNNFVHQILDVGTFHADPHQGNIMVSEGKPYWIDFGMIGRIAPKEIDIIQNMVMAIINQDTDALIDAMMSLGAGSSKTNRDKLYVDVDLFLSRFSGTTSISDMDMSALLNDIMDLAGKHHIKLPGTMTLLARAVIAIEGVIEQLCPELNLLDIISKKLIDRMKKNFDIKQTLIDAGKGIIGTGKKVAEIPGLASEALKGIAKGKMKLNTELTGLDEPMDRAETFIKNIVLVVIACVMFIGGCILCTVNLLPTTTIGAPLLAVIMLVFSISLGIFAVLRLGKKSKK